jgi:hypothetical protein
MFCCPTTAQRCECVGNGKIKKPARVGAETDYEGRRNKYCRFVMGQVVRKFAFFL